MITAVIDTSALMRLYIPDGPVPESLERLLAGAERDEVVLMAPELLFAEAGQVLYKKCAQKLLTKEEAFALLREITCLPFHTAGHTDLIEDALGIALTENITAYDAIFLALAERFTAYFITVDEKLQKTAHTRGLPTVYRVS